MKRPLQLRQGRPPERPLTIEEVARVANSKHVPLLVDAAAQLPPASNLRRFLAAGADLVAFSGGKADYPALTSQTARPWLKAPIPDVSERLL